MIPGVHYLCDPDVAMLADALAERAEIETDESRAAYSRTMAEALRDELVRRRINRSIDADPCADYWFGRLAR